MSRDGFANFFLGLGLGVGLGLLFAPRSGDETRQILKERADEGADYLKTHATEALDKGRQALDRQRDQILDAMAAGRQAYREKIEETPSQPA